MMKQDVLLGLLYIVIAVVSSVRIGRCFSISLRQDQKITYLFNALVKKKENKNPLFNTTHLHSFHPIYADIHSSTQ